MWGVTLWVAAVAALILLIRPNLFEKSRPLGIITHLLMILPFFALASRFLVNDTSIQYVAAFGGESLPHKYRFAATWAAREGPILMWVVWLTLLAWIWRKPMTGKFVESSQSRDFRLELSLDFHLHYY